MQRVFKPTNGITSTSLCDLKEWMLYIWYFVVTALKVFRENYTVSKTYNHTIYMQFMLIVETGKNVIH